MSETAPGPTWWQASDGRWYPPELHPDRRNAPPSSAPSPGPPPAPSPAPSPAGLPPLPAVGAAPSAGRPPVPEPSVATGSGPGSTAVRTAYPYPVRPGFGDAPIGAGTGFVAGVSNQTAIGSPDRNRPTATRTRSRVRPLRVVVLVVLVAAIGIGTVYVTSAAGHRRFTSIMNGLTPGNGPTSAVHNTPSLVAQDFAVAFAANDQERVNGDLAPGEELVVGDDEGQNVNAVPQQTATNGPDTVVALVVCSVDVDPCGPASPGSAVEEIPTRQYGGRWYVVASDFPSCTGDNEPCSGPS